MKCTTNYIVVLFLCLLIFTAFFPVDMTATVKVGTPKGEFNVSPLGGAAYSITIACPPGVNGMEPKIGLTYNSQGGYGLAGYGVNISGISVITRGLKDLFHDGIVKGISYKSYGDALFLDGKRLIPQVASSESYFTIEGDPYVEVVRHGSLYDGSTDIWFEVIDHHNNMVYKYGETSDAQLRYTNGNNMAHISSWYISSAEDANTNYITYTYTQNNLCVLPTKVSYGMNRNAGNSFQLNKIEFEYEALGVDALPFIIEDAKGSLSVRLKAISSKTYNNIYRSYELAYDTMSDMSYGKFARLTSVTEKNGDGESMNPVSFSWNPLPSASVAKTDLAVSMEDINSSIQRKDINLIPSDLNGDGVNDIIRLSSVKIITGPNSYSLSTYLYVSKSQVGTKGDVSYSFPVVYDLGAQFSEDDLKSILGGAAIVDFDGDGVSDLLIPRFTVVGSSKALVCFFVMGKHATAGNTVIDCYSCPLITNGNMPLLACFDANGDGRDDVFCLEKGKSGLYYPGCLTGLNDTSTGLIDYQNFTFNLPKTPKRLFAADFNNDGLKDLIVFHESGYKIYLNQGSSDSSLMFNDICSISGTNVKNSWRMEHGDFNADGLTDFVFNIKGESTLKFALNNGNGTFDVSTAYDLGFGNQGTTADNVRFAVLVSDLDHDGRSDVVVSKANYNNYGIYICTSVRWLYSTGNSLELFKSVTTHAKNDAREGRLVFGDYDGDGYDELLSYGNSLIANSTTDDPALHLYKTGSDMVEKGKVCQISDGLGKTVNISYASLTNPGIYQAGNSTAYPMVERRMPLPVVSQVACSNGAAGPNTTQYQYQGLKAHIAGKGLLGFTGTTVSNEILGIVTENTTAQWDTTQWVPQVVRTETHIGTSVETEIDSLIMLTAKRNYMAVPQTVVTTDADGNVSHTTYTYDAAKGVPLTVNQSYDNGAMWKNTTYSNYLNFKKSYLPLTITNSSKHSDDPAQYSSVTTLAYDSCGRISSQVQHAGTSMALTTTYTYDDFGNRLSSVSSGANVTSVTTLNSYDNNGQFLTYTQTSPSTVSILYTYDNWGNPTQKRMYTPSTHITEYTYDKWGSPATETSPHGVVTTYEEGWGTTAAKRYYQKQATDGQPWVKVWYDECGREVQRESIGPDDIDVVSTTTYDNKSNVSATTSTLGCLTLSENFTYDNLGRVISDVHSSGRATTYSYGNRSLTAIVNGHEYAKTFDAWGNVKTATDSAATVTYTYYSNGLPATTTSGGATVSMQYDVAGNRTSITDPDAGTTTSTYSADGKLLSQTDARGVTSTYTYNALGCLTTQQTGSKTITNTYGSYGSSKLLPQQSAMGSCSVSYSYDNDDRMTAETRSYPGGTTLSFSYAYNNLGQLTQTICPSDVTVGYGYDSHGFLTSMTVNGQQVYNFTYTNGVRDSVQLLSVYDHIANYDSCGYLIQQTWERNGATRKKLYEFDRATGNLKNRSSVYVNIPVVIGPKSNPDESNGDRPSIGPMIPYGQEWAEQFNYDALDRLVSVRNYLNQLQDTIVYAANGNILSRTALGTYSYDATGKPHAVLSVTNPQGLVSQETLETTFGDLGKIEQIEQGDYETTIDYGPDGERWRSVLQDDGSVTRTVLYAGDYEMVTTGSVTRHFYYLGNGIIVMKEGSTVTPLVAVADHLGSITHLLTADGICIFKANYDAWGQQTVSTNTIGFHRGYCGHEMLPEYGLINMNGRLYDPLIGRFLSPDNYVQQPDNSQNFNRYSYCLNNPLKYTDPSGEWFGLDDLIVSAVGGLINLGTNLIQGNVHSFWQGLSLFGTGALAGEAALYSGPLAPFTSAAITSLGNDIVNQSFEKGFGHINWNQAFNNLMMSEMIAGASTSLSCVWGSQMSDFVSSLGIKGPAVNNMIYQSLLGGATGATIEGGLILVNGGSFGEAMQGALRGGSVGLVSGVVSGLSDGIRIARHEGVNPWNGRLSPNKKGGIGMQLAEREFLDNGGTIYAREVTVDVDGVKNRFDFVGEKDGMLYLYEVKNGPSAHFTKNQKINLPKIQNGGINFIPVGKNALDVPHFRYYVNKHIPYDGKFTVTIRWFF